MDYLKQGQHFGKNKDQLIVNDIILNTAKVFSTTRIPWHYHENAYFLLNIEGYFNEITREKNINVIPGSLLFHHSQDPHINKNITENVDFFHVELTDAWFKKYDLSPNFMEGSLQLENPFLKSVFNRIYIESTIKDNVTRIAIDSLVLQAFSIILRQQAKSTYSKPDWTTKITEIINEERWENLSLNSLATTLNLHPVYLSRKFPEYFNMNIGEYIRDKKLERAAKLLRSKPFNNASVAYECGFCDESHFLKLFKMKYGITPNKYKKLLKKS